MCWSYKQSAHVILDFLANRSKTGLDVSLTYLDQTLSVIVPRNGCSTV